MLLAVDRGFFVKEFLINIVSNLIQTREIGPINVVSNGDKNHFFLDGENTLVGGREARETVFLPTLVIHAKQT